MIGAGLCTVADLVIAPRHTQSRAGEFSVMPQEDEFVEIVQPGHDAVFQRVGNSHRVARLTGGIDIANDDGNLLQLPFAQLLERNRPLAGPHK